MQAHPTNPFVCRNAPGGNRRPARLIERENRAKLGLVRYQFDAGTAACAALHQLAHLLPYSSAESWTRNDAALALAALAGLLGFRDP
jgi:hypothetical protein